ncbi:barstar family protein [Endothiovibrio diazotrophicus]
MRTLDAMTAPSWQCIHFLSADSSRNVRKDLLESGVKVIDVDLFAVASDVEFFDAFSTALSFPDYFGNNWDAFDECVADLEWIDLPGYVVFVSGARRFWESSTETAGRLVESWLGAAQQWGGEGVYFHLIFSLE